MNIQKISITTPKAIIIRKTAAAALMTVGVLAGAHAVAKNDNKNNNVTPPTNIEKEEKVENKKETNKNDTFKDLFINLGMGTAVILGAGALLMNEEKKHADALNEIYARHAYKDVDVNKTEEK